MGGRSKSSSVCHLVVPNNQMMADVMRVVKDAATSSLKQGSWVRIKRGVYRDDIAQ